MPISTKKHKWKAEGFQRKTNLWPATGIREGSVEGLCRIRLRSFPSSNQHASNSIFYDNISINKNNLVSVEFTESGWYIYIQIHTSTYTHTCVLAKRIIKEVHDQTFSIFLQWAAHPKGNWNKAFHVDIWGLKENVVAWVMRKPILLDYHYFHQLKRYGKGVYFFSLEICIWWN